MTEQPRRTSPEIWDTRGHHDTPACWDWPLPSDAMMASNIGYPGDLLLEWHEHRCAACGTNTRRTVKDHDHDTGLTRKVPTGRTAEILLEAERGHRRQQLPSWKP